MAGQVSVKGQRQALPFVLVAENVSGLSPFIPVEVVDQSSSTPCATEVRTAHRVCTDGVRGGKARLRGSRHRARRVSVRSRQHLSVAKELSGDRRAGLPGAGRGRVCLGTAHTGVFSLCKGGTRSPSVCL